MQSYYIEKEAIELKFCLECGSRLVLKECNGEGEVPYCEPCAAFRFPVFSTAMSTAVLNRELDRILLIQQYGRQNYILLAGYVNKGENAEAALIREVKEEAGLTVIAYEYMRSEYFAPSNTLMLNFISVADTEDLSGMSDELDHAAWFTLDEAGEAILGGSLAESFLLTIIAKLRQGRTLEELTPVSGDIR